ncbi:MAG: EAL domain-containing protein, partial [Burkholderiales bacterium]
QPRAGTEGGCVNTKPKARAPGNLRLRADAESKLARAPAKGPARPAEELLHELQVHQIELEMQNDELRRSQVALEESRDRYLDLYEFAPVGYLTVTAEGLISEVNLTGATLLQVERKKLLQRRFAHLIAPGDRDRWHRLFIGALRHDERQNSEFALERGDGVVFHARLDCVRIVAADESAPVLRVALTDISERKAAETAALEREALLTAILNGTADGILVVDTQGRVLKANRRFRELWQIPDDVLASGEHERLLGFGLHQLSDPDAFLREVRRLCGSRAESLDTINFRDGRVFERFSSVFHFGGRDGRLWSFREITDRRVAEARIEQLAFYDSLTQLPNRRLVLDRLHHALAASNRSRELGAVLFIDLDDFKTLNDTRGHDVGDLLLKEVASRLAACVRENDTVGRLGGDEFLVILERLGANAEEAATQAGVIGNKLLAALAHPCVVAGHAIHITGSAGVALFGDHEETADGMLKRADLAMYRGKAGGRNTLCFFDLEMQNAVTARAALEAELRQALRDSQFRLLFQPQVDGAGRVTGAEALIRWQHPRRGLVCPAEFVPSAEETGLIVPLGRWVLRAACAELAAWSVVPNTAHLTMAVDVSAREFRHPDFVDEVSNVLEETGANPQKLVLEFTESLLLDDTDDTIAKMVALKAKGVSFAVDDFGIGYSSLIYLKHLPVDQLKIDQSFVRGVLIDPNDAAIAGAILALGHSLGLAVIAEGVESAEQREFLARLGCNRFQGYLFGRPGPVEALLIAAV